MSINIVRGQARQFGEFSVSETVHKSRLEQ